MNQTAATLAGAAVVVWGLTVRMTQKQFDALVRFIEASAELEARKVHCEMTSDDYEWESTAADDARQEANRLLVGEDE